MVGEGTGRRRKERERRRGEVLFPHVFECFSEKPQILKKIRLRRPNFSVGGFIVANSSPADPVIRLFLPPGMLGRVFQQ